VTNEISVISGTCWTCGITESNEFSGGSGFCGCSGIVNSSENVPPMDPVGSVDPVGLVGLILRVKFVKLERVKNRRFVSVLSRF